MMSDERDDQSVLPVGAVDASGQPAAMVEVAPPEQPPMIDADGDGEINGEDRGETPDDLQVQGGE